LAAFQAQQQKWLVHDWEDVENWACAVLTFEDGARATCLASDTVLGGMDDTVQIYLANARINCNFTHSTSLQVYAPDPSVFPGEPLQEKLTTNAGWSYPPIDMEYMLGYAPEIQDFVAAVAEDRLPVSDAALGRAVVEAIYAAYLSAEAGRRVDV
ncbi:MAG: gfo/Idh/MocA family oxidoreductase, partial [Chloroflexota bacterium]